MRRPPIPIPGTNVEWVGTIGAGPLLGVKRKLAYAPRQRGLSSVHDPGCSLSRNHVSCGWPDLNVESEIADAIGELGCGAAWIAVGEMIGAEILVASAISQHVKMFIAARRVNT